LKLSKSTTAKRWELVHGDCVEQLVRLKPNSIDYSIFSPPFAQLYTYSEDPRDMGNCLTYEEFFEHFKFLTPELFRLIRPGRLVSFHCMNLPLLKERDGRLGLRDFRGNLIKSFEDAGFVFHSEVCIWKNPVTAMQRTKAIGLLHKQIKKDSCVSRQGIPDYLVTMRKDGVNENRVKGRFDKWIGEVEKGPTIPAKKELTDKDAEAFSIEVWQRYASPVWMDIDQSDTLQFTHVRGEKDERHICPLQLGVIRRGIELWSNEGDLVLSPFAGIGSEGYVALQEGRRFFGVELKEEYYRWALKNLAHAESNSYRSTLFGPRRMAETRKSLV
jgi:hypothetical protein